MFLAENENERRQYSNPHNNHSQQQKQSKQRQLTPGEAYYEMDNDHQKGQTRLMEEFYQLVFKTRKGHTIKVECSRQAYEQIPFNQQGSLTYKKNTLVKFKYLEGTIYN